MSGAKAITAFRSWWDTWWKNKPSIIAHHTAMEAFLAGWDARGRRKK